MIPRTARQLVLLVALVAGCCAVATARPDPGSLPKRFAAPEIVNIPETAAVLEAAAVLKPDAVANLTSALEPNAAANVTAAAQPAAVANLTAASQPPAVVNAAVPQQGPVADLVDALKPAAAVAANITSAIQQSVVAEVNAALKTAAKVVEALKPDALVKNLTDALKVEADPDAKPAASDKRGAAPKRPAASKAKGGASAKAPAAPKPPKAKHAEHLAKTKHVSKSRLKDDAVPPGPARRSPAELSNSFIITQLQDLQPSNIRGSDQTPCEYAVKRAKSLNQKHFSIVVTAYWAGDVHHVDHYCFKDVSNAYPNGVGFPRPTIDSVAAWRKGLQRCFAAAVDAGFTGIQVLNHIDSLDGSHWRNFLDFDPLAKYDGWSYEDVVVRPASEALRAVVKPDTKVWFMVSGEMGRSIFAHPESYNLLIAKYRGSISRNVRNSHVKIGVALHWNKVCGDCFTMPRADSPFQYNATFHRVFDSQKKQILGRFNVPMVRRVFESADVLGLSHYAPAPTANVGPEAFSLPIDTAASELAHFGIDLREIIRRPGKEFVFSEVGIGGGDPNNQRAASSLLELATNIHNGIWAVYNVAQDPWRNQDYKEYRRDWFKALTSFLYGGGAPYKVNAAFIWSVGTWDVAAIHPISTSEEGTYADWEIVKWMRWLSARVPK